MSGTDRPGFRYVTRLPKGEQCVGMVEHRGHVFVATGAGVYRLAPRRKGTYKLVPVLFVGERHNAE